MKTKTFTWGEEATEVLINGWQKGEVSYKVSRSDYRNKKKGAAYLIRCARRDGGAFGLPHVINC